MCKAPIPEKPARWPGIFRLKTEAKGRRVASDGSFPKTRIPSLLIVGMTQEALESAGPQPCPQEAVLIGVGGEFKIPLETLMAPA